MKIIFAIAALVIVSLVRADDKVITKDRSPDGEFALTTTLEVKGDECTYLTSHDSGHYAKLVWKKGVGLIEHASNYGAEKDGFRLKRSATK